MTDNDQRLTVFLELFDAYASARADLRAAADDSDDAHALISHCTSLWGLLCQHRKTIMEAK